ncbi:alpha/beta fold hydrolase [soil metagenome]
MAPVADRSALSAGRLIWERDGRHWPHRDSSRFVDAGGLRWHVQQMGKGPVALLIHGTGAATHSWRGIAPLLARHYTVVAPDLPGHGFTDTPRSTSHGLSLPGMAAALRALVAALGVEVRLIVAHSAGAAIAARICLDVAGDAPSDRSPRAGVESTSTIPAADDATPHHARAWQADALISLNGAFLPLAGLPGLLFPPVAKLMAATPIASRLFAWRASDRASVERLITGTGSSLDAEGVALYGQLVRNPVHAAGALGMMAQWDVRPLLRDLPQLKTPLHLIVGTHDRAVPPEQARRVQLLVPGATLTRLPGLGHLAHEERPEEVARCVIKASGDAAAGVEQS